MFQTLLLMQTKLSLFEFSKLLPHSVLNAVCSLCLGFPCFDASMWQRTCWYKLGCACFPFPAGKPSKLSPVIYCYCYCDCFSRDLIKHHKLIKLIYSVKFSHFSKLSLDYLACLNNDLKKTVQAWMQSDETVACIMLICFWLLTFVFTLTQTPWLKKEVVTKICGRSGSS